MSLKPRTSRALYYPYIEVPNNEWFARVLLYWDEVGAIVPHEYIEDPDKLSPYMVELVKEGLVRQVIPRLHLGQVNNFKGAFLEYVNAQPRRGVRPTYAWPRIHMEKMDSLGAELCKRDLAKRDSDYPGWFRVEPRTAEAFMAYLAGVLGQIPRERYYPITDQPSSLAPFLGTGSRDDSRENSARQLILERVLPAPSREIEPARLADFKAAHQTELRRFRLLIEDRISEVASISDADDREQRLKVVANTLEEQTSELIDRMKASRLPKISLDTICVVLGSSIATYQALAGGEPAIGLAGAGLGVAPAIRNAFLGGSLELEDRPLAYAAIAQSQLG